MTAYSLLIGSHTAATTLYTYNVTFPEVANTNLYVGTACQLIRILCSGL